MKVICIGEMLIDFVCTQVNSGLKGGCYFVKKSGGAPANVAACISTLGGDATFVGAVGNDPFGEYLLDSLVGYKVNVDFAPVLTTPTTLAFVSLADEGERDFSFNRGADEHLVITESMIKPLLDDSIIHLGSATALLGGELFESYLLVANSASLNGNLIVFDPNYRVDLWTDNIEKFKKRCSIFIKMADVVKVSEDELLLLTGDTNLAAGCRKLHKQGVSLVYVTLGKNGCLVSQNEKQHLVPAYKIEAVDTTGAGDSFIGAILYKMATSSGIETLFADEMLDFVAFAEKVSAKVCSKVGAMTALPSLEDINNSTFVLSK